MLTTSSPGPTAREVLELLRPQLDDLQSGINEVRKDTVFLRECTAAQKVQQEANERRITRLETKVFNGGSSKDGPALVEAGNKHVIEIVQLVATWLFRFMLGSAAIAFGVNIGKVIEYLMPK